MKLREMFFKGRRVFVEVDDANQIILTEGRARMRYQAEDDRVYTPWPGNLSATPEAAPPSAAEPTRTGLPTRKTPPGASPLPVLPVKSSAIQAWTDGGCIGNPGPSGLGFLIVLPDGKRVEKGEPLGQGTNNIAELTAILRVLQTLDDLGVSRSQSVTIHTDSTYAIGVLTANWKARVNQQLIADIRKALQNRNVTLAKVKGHAGHPENERVDYLANTSARTQQSL
jgi:ribonuclease HI